MASATASISSHSIAPRDLKGEDDSSSSSSSALPFEFVVSNLWQ
jgi:hypothetical protein